MSSCTHQQNVRLQALLNVDPAEFSAASADPQQDTARQNHLGRGPTQAGTDQFAVAFARNAGQHERNAEQIGNVDTAAQEFLRTYGTERDRLAETL